MPSETVFVTGARGFIGANVAALFRSQNYDVFSLVRPDINKTDQNDDREIEIELSFESLCALDLVPSIIVHCAGSSLVSQTLREPYLEYQKTVQPTLDILEYMRACAPAARLVYISSAGVYGNASASSLAENSDRVPLSPYGSYKLICEELCRTYALNFGVKASLVRLFSVYGPGLKKQLLWDACVKERVGDYTFFGTGQEIRDWIFISDAADLILKAAEIASAECPVINGGSGIGTTVSEILGILFQQLNSPHEPRFTGLTKQGDPRTYIANPSRAMELGWLPRVSLQHGLSRYAQWFREVDL